MQSFFGPEKTISFKEVLILTLPALTIGLIARITFLAAIPEGYFVADSSSYLEFSDRLLNEGVFDLSEKRRWLYPIFIAFIKLLPIGSGHWSLVPMIQHLTGLIAIVGVGWCTAQVVTHPRIIVPITTSLAAIWPRTLWYEHVFNADTMLTSAFIAVVALLLTPKICKKKYGLILLMVAFTLLAGMKGVGRFLWAGSSIGLFMIHGNPARWLWSKASIFFAAVSFFFIATVGKTSQGDWLALSSSLPLVRTEGEPHANYRKTLKNQILEAKSHGNNYPWEVRDFKKRLSNKDSNAVSPLWAELTANRLLYSKVARSFWTEAVATHPIQFSFMTVKTIGIASSSPITDPRLDPMTFWNEQEIAIQSRLTRGGDYFYKRFGIFPKDIERKFSLNQADNKTGHSWLLNTSQWLDKRFRWAGRRGIGPKGNPAASRHPELFIKPLGLAALLGASLGMAIKTKRQQRIAALSPLLIYLIGTYAVGDAIPRYLIPVEWIGMIFAGIFIDTLITAGGYFSKATKKL